jgi:hypothetical protein
MNDPANKKYNFSATRDSKKVYFEFIILVYLSLYLIKISLFN